jgi:two-component system response regulator HydG
VEVSDLPAVLQQSRPKSGFGSPGTIAENERRILKETLEECDWNKKQAALQLGISRSSLYEKIKKYQITKPTLH